MKKGNIYGKTDITKEERKLLKRANTLLYLSNMIFFGLSIVLILIGICYLTVFRHDYTFTYFSLTTMAGFLLAFGIIVLILSIINVILINSDKIVLIIIGTIIILVIFVAVLIIGIWELAFNASDSLNYDTRNETMEAIRGYDERVPDVLDTQRMNWLQTRYNCCGIDSYTDWRTLFLYGGQYAPNRYVDQWTINNNMPYIDHVPDSCCVYPSYNCGKQFSYNQALDRNAIINTKGCLDIYIFNLSKDLNFTGGLNIAIAAVALVIGGCLTAFYMIIEIRN